MATGKHLKINTLTVDFEIAFSKAALLIFGEDVVIIGCLYHWKNAIKRYLESLKMGDEVVSYMMQIGKMDLLTIIPVSEIVSKGIPFLRSMIDESACQDKWNKFWVYFIKNWILLHKPETWNIHTHVQNKVSMKNRTNNPLERYNRTMGEHFARGNPSVEEFIEVIKWECDNFLDEGHDILNFLREEPVRQDVVPTKLPLDYLVFIPPSPTRNTNEEEDEDENDRDLVDVTGEIQQDGTNASSEDTLMVALDRSLAAERNKRSRSTPSALEDYHLDVARWVVEALSDSVAGRSVVEAVEMVVGFLVLWAVCTTVAVWLAVCPLEISSLLHKYQQARHILKRFCPAVLFAMEGDWEWLPVAGEEHRLGELLTDGKKAREAQSQMTTYFNAQAVKERARGHEKDPGPFKCTEWIIHPQGRLPTRWEYKTQTPKEFRGHLPSTDFLQEEYGKWSDYLGWHEEYLKRHNSSTPYNDIFDDDSEEGAHKSIYTHQNDSNPRSDPSRTSSNRPPLAQNSNQCVWEED
eukprot:gene34631-42719_t